LITPRAPARIWVETLKRITTVLSNSDANDVMLFGSQAMSVYTQRALASKDLDLIVPGINIRVLEDLCDEFTDSAGKRPVYDFTVGQYSGRRYPVGHIYLRHGSGYPLVVEFFQTFLGFESRKLTPFLTFRQKWGINVQVLVPEAIIGTRLSFRPPERVTRFNAMRLSRFIRSLGKSIDWSIVNSFLDAFQLRGVASENIDELRAKRISIPGSSNLRPAN
jgi:hypothetical protein